MTRGLQAAMAKVCMMPRAVSRLGTIFVAPGAMPSVGGLPNWLGAPPGNASLDFVDRWAERLANKQAGAKNQPHYNAALAQSNLSATVLPCDLFPNGHRPPHPTAAQTPTQTLTYPQLHPKPHRDHPKPYRDHPKPHREQATATRARRGAGRRAAPP